MGPWGPSRRASFLTQESTILQSLQIVFQARGDLKVWNAALLVELIAEDGSLLAHFVRDHKPNTPCSNGEIHTETLHIQGSVRPSDVARRGCLGRFLTSARWQSPTVNLWSFS
jgi:hypothetical protein